MIQVGKWRKQVTVASVAQCKDNPQPDKSLTLPKNHTEGDIPNIAISTGGADTLECLLVRVGIDPAEYGQAARPGGTASTSSQGGACSPSIGGAPNTSPPGPASSTGLWDSQKDLMPYDIVLLSCEGSETTAMNQQALHDYASAGGRVFASHFHYAWFNTGPYGSENLATWTPGDGNLNNINATINTSFPKGQALDTWLGAVGALGVAGAPAEGFLPIQQARHNADVSAANTPSQAWISADSATKKGANATEYLSFNTPTNAAAGEGGVPNYCGRVVFSDLHVGAASGDYGGLGIGLGQVTPTGCANNPLSPQEKALEFMLFDLSSCIDAERRAAPGAPIPTPK